MGNLKKELLGNKDPYTSTTPIVLCGGLPFPGKDKDRIMDNGWIKIHRKIQDNFLYSDSQALHLWIHILLKCNHKEREHLFNNKKITTKRGSFITGRKKLSEETGISESKIYRLLKTFKSEHLIEQQITSKYSIISVIKYSQYQSSEQVNEQPVNNKRTSSEHQVNTNKKGKNNKNDKKKHIELAKQIIEYLNEKAKRNFDITKDSNFKELIARMKDGYTVDQFKFIIDNKLKDQYFKDNPKYYNPDTLFRKSNIEKYLNEKFTEKIDNKHVSGKFDIPEHIKAREKMEKLNEEFEGGIK